MKLARVALCSAAAGLAAFAATAVRPAVAVEYVKICSLYGEGFFYVPGSDTCIKLGGYVRADGEYLSSLGVVTGSGPMAAEGRLTRRSTQENNFTTRAVFSMDVRSQTAYGPLRSYVRMRFDSAKTVTNTQMERAYIEFAGLMAGRAQSYFDIYSNDRQMSYFDVRTDGNTGNIGVNLLGYRALFGNGISFSASLEEPAGHYRAGIVDGSAAAFALNGVTTGDEAAVQLMDMIANLRVDGNWGYAGISGVFHQARGAYYGTPNSTLNNYPADKFGFAVAAGGLLNLPNGDQFGINWVYSEGAAGYATRGGNWQIYSGDTVGVGWVTDGVFDNAGGVRSPLHLTTVWSLNGGYQHVWNPQWRTSLYGGYVKVFYNEESKRIISSHLPGPAGSIQCGVAAAGAVWPPVDVSGFGGGVGNSCTPDFSYYQIGSRTQFNPVPQLELGLDVVYTYLNTAYKGAGRYGANVDRPQVARVDDQAIWSAIFRVQRNFYP